MEVVVKFNHPFGFFADKAEGGPSSVYSWMIGMRKCSGNVLSMTLSVDGRMIPVLNYEDCINKVKMHEELEEIAKSSKKHWVKVFACAQVYLRYNKSMEAEVAYRNAVNLVDLQLPLEV